MQPNVDALAAAATALADAVTAAPQLLFNLYRKQVNPVFWVYVAAIYIYVYVILLWCIYTYLYRQVFRRFWQKSILRRFYNMW
jgi:hypothetical protein